MLQPRRDASRDEYDFVLYRYQPSQAAAALFVVLFALTTAFHTWQVIRTRKWNMIPLVIGGYSSYSLPETLPPLPSFRSFAPTRTCISALCVSQAPLSDTLHSGSRRLPRPHRILQRPPRNTALHRANPPAPDPAGALRRVDIHDPPPHRHRRIPAPARPP